jgi:hypothetical protein
MDPSDEIAADEVVPKTTVCRHKRSDQTDDRRHLPERQPALQPATIDKIIGIVGHQPAIPAIVNAGSSANIDD